MHEDESLATLPAEDAVAEPTAVGATECPRCQKPLIDPAGLGWCKACGYCRSLETEKSNQLLATAQGPSSAGALAGAAGQIPIWFLILIAGIGGVAGLSLAAGEMLPAGRSLQRALWTTLQIAAGLVIMFVGQLVAVVLIAPEDEKLSFKDAIVPTRLWGLVGKRLPRLSPCLWTSVWGVALVVCALLFVGGLQHWFKYLPNSNAAKAKSW